MQFEPKTVGLSFVNGVTQNKIGSHDYHTIGMLTTASGGMLFYCSYNEKHITLATSFFISAANGH